MKLAYAAFLACLPLSAIAQVETAFTYQGELKLDGALAAGEFDLEVCVYAVASGGAPLACAPPVENLPLVDGRFTIALDFGAVFDGTARFLEMRVRAGSESTPHAALQPRQSLRSTPMAQYAARAPFTGLTGVPPSLLDGDNVGVTQIAAGAGLSGGTITSTGTLAIAPGGVTGAMLAPNAVGLAQIDPSQVQARISGSCAQGEFFQGFGANGAPICALLPLAFDRIVESSLDYGFHVRLVLRPDGRPLLAYYEQSAQLVRLYDCADAVCANGTPRNIATVGDVGKGIALVLRTDGRPLLAYIDDTNDTLRVYSCNDAACTAGSDTLLATSVLAPSLDMALRADGNAVMVFRSSTNFLMQTWHCSNINCTAGTKREHNTLPIGVAVVIRPDGRPLLGAGGDGGAADSPRFWDCDDAGCTTGTLRPTSGVAFQDLRGMRLRADGRALMLTNRPGISQSIVACADVNCTTAPGAAIPGCNASGDAEIAFRADGTAVIACTPAVNSEFALALYDCGNSSCSIGSTRQLLPLGRAGIAVAVAIRADDRPVIAYHDETNNDIAIYVCATPQCP